MLSGKYIFAQLIEFLPQKYFQRLVMKYEGDKYSTVVIIIICR
ncbi:MAG: DUF4372 domain-containing protein [Fermentimonas sp.]|nr:DUF4372 domain-containing protein [Fermentimonas sp.]MDD4008972.1 DUF4372 domain-containing protein [Fermentimonas sp.]MDD4697930.1 DUF4372 domain-containing protein [Fermentimonas sp.]